MYPVKRVLFSFSFLYSNGSVEFAESQAPGNNNNSATTPAIFFRVRDFLLGPNNGKHIPCRSGERERKKETAYKHRKCITKREKTPGIIEFRELRNQSLQESRNDN
jgi:hypothetical protein